jgi:plastocyanin
VDLGPIRNLRNQDAQIRIGDEIVARGSFARVANAPVLLATQVQSDGEMVTISRQELASQQRLQREEDLLETYARYQGQGMPYGQFQSRQEAYPYGQTQNPREGYRREEQAGQAQYVRGQVTRTSRVQLPGINEPLLFAQVRTNQGRPITLYLGPVGNLENVSVNRGDEIDVRGPILEIHGQPIVLARQFRIHGESIPIAERAREEMTAASKHIRGEIQRSQTIRIPGVDEPLRIALIRTDDGQSIIAELGPEPRLEGITLNRGDEIDVRGRSFRLGNHRILLAERVRAHGETVMVAEELQPRAASERSQERLVRIFAGDFGLKPANIIAQPGELLDIELTNQSEDLPHSIVFDLPYEQVGLQRAVQPGSSRILTLRVPEQPGRYAFFCPVDDHAERGMEGYLIVRSGQIY